MIAQRGVILKKQDGKLKRRIKHNVIDVSRKIVPSMKPKVRREGSITSYFNQNRG